MIKIGYNITIAINGIYCNGICYQAKDSFVLIAYRVYNYTI